MQTFKGFNKDMTCRGFQYKEGESYHEDMAKACKSGFHACEYPLDCFSYYNPSESEFHIVEQSGDISRHGNDSKIASTDIKIGAKLSIADMVKFAINFTMERVKPEAKKDEDYGASSATGDYGASSATGSCGASSATGYKGASESLNPLAFAVAWGYKGKVRGVKGSHLVLADWRYVGEKYNDYWDSNNKDAWEFNGAKMFIVDGEKYKENVWYTIVDGEIVEVEEIIFERE